MAEITKELGIIPVSRGDCQATTEYYKDNIVPYNYITELMVAYNFILT